MSLNNQTLFYVLLKLELGVDKLTYQELLTTWEWKNFRNKIVFRDGNHCTHCDQQPTKLIKGKHFRPLRQSEINERAVVLNSSIITVGNSTIKIRALIPTEVPTDYPIYLHVHHHYYINGKLPWEYPQSALTTLCNSCHKSFHEENPIPVYSDESMNEELSLTICPKCTGIGHFDEYSHVQGGVCFQCHGAKYLELMDQYRN
jgi:Zn finger protein HypA/HybF involved in hydrogenase expression